jgi:hypothetical protein
VAGIPAKSNPSEMSAAQPCATSRVGLQCAFEGFASPEGNMSNLNRRALFTFAALGAFMFVNVSRLSAQSQASPAPTYTSDATSRHDGHAQSDNGGALQNGADNPTDDGRQLHKADGKRQPGLPAEAYAVAPGTKFLVSLEDDLSSKGTEENKRVRVTTLEPLEAGSGIYLPAGAEIEGRVTRVESAGMAGRAKLLLTFDYLHTRFGKLPIVAEVSGVPGDHSIKSTELKEGLIEGRSSTQEDAAEAAAAAAALGALKGVKDKDKREAAEGAAGAALAAYLAESGRGHELNIPKGAKLELELQRALYLLKD